MLIKETDSAIITQFYKQLQSDGQWPNHIQSAEDEEDIESIKKALLNYFKKSKSGRGSSELIALCEETGQVPKSLRKTLVNIKELLDIL